PSICSATCTRLRRARPTSLMRMSGLALLTAMGTHFPATLTTCLPNWYRHRLKQPTSSLINSGPLRTRNHLTNTLVARSTDAALSFKSCLYSPLRGSVCRPTPHFPFTSPNRKRPAAKPSSSSRSKTPENIEAAPPEQSHRASAPPGSLVGDGREFPTQHAECEAVLSPDRRVACATRDLGFLAHFRNRKNLSKFF